MFHITHLLKPLQEIYKTSQWKTSKLQKGSFASKLEYAFFAVKALTAWKMWV